MRNRIDHWCTVEPGNPNPRVHRPSGKLGEASFHTGTVDPRVGISLSPLNTNDGFSLSGVQEISFQPDIMTYQVQLLFLTWPLSNSLNISIIRIEFDLQVL